MTTDALSKSGNCQNGYKRSELTRLKGRAEQLKLKSKAKATKDAYKKDCATFAAWCFGHKLTPLPATAEVIELYITHLNDQARAPSTIARALTSISQMHKLSGFASPTNDPQVIEALKGIRRDRGTAQRQARAILAPEIKKMVRACPPDVLGKRDKALLLIGWAGALRRSELVALDCEHIDPCEEGIVLNIVQSKGDQAGAGQRVAIPSLDNEFCPVTALFNWRALLPGAHGHGPVFCVVGNAGKNRFFGEIDHARRLGDRSVSLIVKRYAKAIGLDPDLYSAHSLRAGWATAAAKIGTPQNVLMRHTRHKSVKTLLTYIRSGELFLNQPLSLLLGP